LLFHVEQISDVIGVVTSVVHDKNFFPDGKVTQTASFRLNHERCVKYEVYNSNAMIICTNIELFYCLFKEIFCL
jgi:hypothetical protein